MNKLIRIAAVSAFLLAILALGMKGTAWATKLGGVNQAPVANGSNPGLPLEARPQGTVITNPPIVPIIPVTDGGQGITVGSCATVLIPSPVANVRYLGTTVNQSQLPTPLVGNLVSCGIQISAKFSGNLGAETQVCFPIPPGKTGFAYYWDGTQWVKTTSPAQNNQSCVTVPVSAPNPVFTALFDQ